MLSLKTLEDWLLSMKNLRRCVTGLLSAALVLPGALLTFSQVRGSAPPVIE